MAETTNPSVAQVEVGPAADLAFLFLQVTPGFIPLEAGIEGPVIWALACIVTPFGLRPLRHAAAARA